MTVNLLMMPAGPALVTELAPGDTTGARLLAEVRKIISSTPAGTAIELVGSRATRWQTAVAGSFQAWGAPQVSVGAGHYLPELVQRYALGARAQDIVSVRAELGQPNPDALTLVALDGSAGLTARAPLSLLDGAQESDAWCRSVLSAQGSATLTPPMDEKDLFKAGVLEPSLWLELTQLRPQSAELFAADTTLGVGRYVAGWEI